MLFAISSCVSADDGSTATMYCGKAITIGTPPSKRNVLMHTTYQSYKLGSMGGHVGFTGNKKPVETTGNSFNKPYITH